jgi:hypothetical protein
MKIEEHYFEIQSTAFLGLLSLCLFCHFRAAKANHRVFQ